MNGEAVDAWVSSVDELLAGGRDDEMVSGDAMRWSPEAVGQLSPADLRDDDGTARAVIGSLAEVWPEEEAPHRRTA